MKRFWHVAYYKIVSNEGRLCVPPRPNVLKMHLMCPKLSKVAALLQYALISCQNDITSVDMATLAESFHVIYIFFTLQYRTLGILITIESPAVRVCFWFFNSM